MDWDQRFGSFNPGSRICNSERRTQDPLSETQISRPKILNRRPRTKKPDPVPEVCNQDLGFILQQECFT